METGRISKKLSRLTDPASCCLSVKTIRTEDSQSPAILDPGNDPTGNEWSSMIQHSAVYILNLKHKNQKTSDT